MEIGAYDPYRYSNTYALERYLGARSILVEPSLQGSLRISKNRPRAELYCAVASRDWGVISFVGDSAVAGIEANLSVEYLRRWELLAESRRWVPAIPVKAIQAAEHLEYVDFLSVDVQGAELEVLEGIDWRHPIGCICIELENADSQKDEACRDFLQSHGYTFRSRLQINEFWELPDYSRRDLIYRPDSVPRVESFIYPYLEPAASAQVLAALESYNAG